MKALCDPLGSPVYVLFLIPIWGEEGEFDEWRIYHTYTILFARVPRLHKDC